MTYLAVAGMARSTDCGAGGTQDPLRIRGDSSRGSYDVRVAAVSPRQRGLLGTGVSQHGLEVGRPRASGDNSNACAVVILVSRSPLRQRG